MKFISLRLAAFAAIASIVCLVSTPLVHDQGSVAPDPNVVAQPASFEAQERFDALNHRKKKHHHHGKRHLHGHYHHGKNHPHHKYKLPLKPKPDPEYCPTTARDTTLVSLVCDGFIVDQILCVNPLPILPMLQGPNCAAIAMAGEPSDDEGDDLEGDLEDGTGDDAGLDTGVETGVETDAAGFREPWP
ncbi:hypothetical protein BG005_002494 [Podila minutissima]|nr:hypothetical protein BG005_002494 [Podila minutissima]